MPDRQVPLQRARDLRRWMTPTERLFWKQLRGRRLAGLRFRRQQPIGPYIADFYCAEARVVLELEGESHDGKEEYDLRRQRWLERQGIRVVRFKDRDVYEFDVKMVKRLEVICLERLANP